MKIGVAVIDRELYLMAGFILMIDEGLRKIVVKMNGDVIGNHMMVMGEMPTGSMM